MILIGCAFITDIPHYIQPVDELWDEEITQLYIGITEARSAILCLLVAFMAWKNYGVRLCGWAGASWFAGQAIDEWTMHNLWKDGTWEYPLFAVLCFGTYYFIKRHDRKRRKADQAKLDH